MRGRTVVAVVAAAGMVSAALVQEARGAPPSSPFRYAVFALGDLTLNNGVRAVDGDVGSNDGTATIGKGVRVAGAVVGRTIRLRANAQPDSLYCLLLEGGSGQTCQTVSLPVVSAAQLPAVQVVPGTTAITVPRNGSTSPIPEGAYGDLRNRQRGVLTLAGGTYVFRSIRVGPRGQLACAAPCEIGVANSVQVQTRARIGGADGTRAAAIRVNVAQTGSRTVFTAAKRSTVSAVVYAPGGGIALRDRGNFVGAFVGGTVRVGKEALVQARVF